MIAGQAFEAGRRGDRAEAKRLDEKAAALIREYRAGSSPTRPSSRPNARWRLRRRRHHPGHRPHAARSTPWRRARRSARCSGPRSSPRRDSPARRPPPTPRPCRGTPGRPRPGSSSARLSLRNGQTDEALRQARYLLDADPERPTGWPRHLARGPGHRLADRATPGAESGQPGQAIEKLAGRSRPARLRRRLLPDGRHPHARSGDRAKAVAVLKDALKVNPDDAIALTMAVQILAEPQAKGRPAPPKADLDQAIAAGEVLGRLATRRATGCSPSPSASPGPVSSSWPSPGPRRPPPSSTRPPPGSTSATSCYPSEAQADPDKARQLRPGPSAEYDKILAAQPNSVEAVNNKAWILHTLPRPEQGGPGAGAKGLLQRVDPNALPGEFFDTLGSIQEAIGRPEGRRGVVQEGARQVARAPGPELPHGPLLMADRQVEGPARPRSTCKVAQAGSDRLPADMAGNLGSLLKQVGQ